MISTAKPWLKHCGVETLKHWSEPIFFATVRIDLILPSHFHDEILSFGGQDIIRLKWKGSHSHYATWSHGKILLRQLHDKRLNVFFQLDPHTSMKLYRWELHWNHWLQSPIHLFSWMNDMCTGILPCKCWSHLNAWFGKVLSPHSSTLIPDEAVQKAHAWYVLKTLNLTF